MYEKDLYKEAFDILNVNSSNIYEKIKEVLDDMILRGSVIRYDTKSGVAVMHISIYKIERRIARKLADLRDRARLINIDATQAIREYEHKTGLTLHENQFDADRKSVV